MPYVARTIVGVSGNLGRPSKTRALVETIVGQAAGRLDARGIVFDVSELAPSLGRRDSDRASWRRPRGRRWSR